MFTKCALNRLNEEAPVEATRAQTPKPATTRVRCMAFLRGPCSHRKSCSCLSSQESVPRLPTQTKAKNKSIVKAKSN